MTTDSTDTQQPIGELPTAGNTSPAQRSSSDQEHGTTVSVKQAAERVGVHEQTLRRWLWAGKVDGAHLVPHGKGEQWRIPVATLEQLGKQEAKPTATQAEADQLRQRVADLERQLELQRALADERRHELDRLHDTMRALSAGVRPPEQSEPDDMGSDMLALADQLRAQVAELREKQEQQARRRWWRRG